MPNFIHSKQIQVYAGGYNLTPFLDKIETDEKVDTAETSCFGNTNKTFISGLYDATLTGDGFYAENSITEDQIDDILGSALGNSQILSWFPNTSAVGKKGYGMLLLNTSYTISSDITKAVSIAIAGQSNVAREGLISLYDIQPVSSSSGVGSTVNLGNTLSFGGSAYLHVIALTGSINDVTVQHSPDGTSWSTLADFGYINSIGAQRLTFTGTVYQYVRASYSGLTGSETFNISINQKIR